MKIGLLSMQRVNNYGSFWQAYCLKGIIEKSGHEVEFIDILPGEKESITEHRKSFGFSKIKRIPYYLFQNRKSAIFDDAQKHILHCSNDANYKSDYDSIIIGSDEVFNCVQKSPWGFTSQLFGDIDNTNVNTYAACFGYTTYEAILESGKSNKIINALSNIKNISVRDQNSANIIKLLIEEEPQIHLDPVIVGDLPIDIPEIKDEKYILVYSYDFRLSDKEVIKQTREYAKKHGYKIISAGFYQDWVDKNVLPTPKELLSYFRNAEFVVTDTFHGTIFSSRMHKQFITVIRDTNKQKLKDLLERINMEERSYSKGEMLQTKIEQEIDYSEYEKLRIKERNRTDSFLNMCFKQL